MNENKTQKMVCPICQGEEFKKEKGRLDSEWGMTDHRADLFICEQCGYMMMFSTGRTWFTTEF